jgi:hypothetical protein
MQRLRKSSGQSTSGNAQSIQKRHLQYATSKKLTQEQGDGNSVTSLSAKGKGTLSGKRTQSN